MKSKILFAFWPLVVKYNHGIALLSSICKERGIDTSLHILSEMDDFVSRLYDESPDYIGFTMVTVHEYSIVRPFMELAQSLGFTVIAGGVFLRRFCPHDIPADHVCRGEAESLPDFILDGDESVFNERQVYTGKLDDLPLPDYDMFAPYPYERDIALFKGKKVLPFHTSRGCPYTCTFCEVSSQHGSLRRREKFVHDMDYLADKYNPDMFQVVDELVPYYNKDWMREMDSNTHRFMAYIHAGVPVDKLDELIDKGLSGCAFGIESSNEVFRNKVFRKGLSDKRLFESVNLLHKRGVPFIAFFLAGYPGQPDTQEDIEMMSKQVGGESVVWQYEKLEVN